uniref:Superoxide dismutase n=1 Tax=Strigamia maritima TaxID=126957 RepID=T1JF74_STRMM
MKQCLLLFFAAQINAIAPPYYGLDRPVLEYELPPLEYLFEDLEPHIDAATIRVHYFGHHAAYTNKLNKALTEWRKINKQASRISLIDILCNLNRIPNEWQKSIKNNGGGYINHNLYWAVMSPNLSNMDRLPTGLIGNEIHEKWSSFVDFRETFTNEALNLFGSGYVWLSRNRTDNQLVISTSVNQDTPITDNSFPILVIDVWEHAYYLKHQNLRHQYIEDWWKLVDWNAVAKLDAWWKGIKFHDEL